MGKRKYAAIGSSVRIVTPKQFIRCGYPLSIKDVMNRDFEEIERQCVKLFCTLDNQPTPEPKPETLSNDWLSLSVVSQTPAMSATVHGMLCAAIAAYRLEKEGFGGKTRKIVEVDGIFEKGQIWTVVTKNLVKTGTRYLGHVYRSSYDGESDYEPGGLEGEQTHCVYTVKQFGSKYKILAEHCEEIDK